MAENGFNRGGAPSNLPAGPEEGTMPLEKPEGPKMDVRTMESDLSSMKESGEGAPRPYVPPPPVYPKKEGGETVFTPPQIEPTAGEESLVIAEEPKRKGGKGLFVTILVLILVLGLGALGYFFVYPKFFQVAEAPAAPQASATPELPQVPTVPQVPVTPEPTPTPSGVQHFSLFKIPADSVVATNGVTSNISSLKQALNLGDSGTPNLREITIRESGGTVSSARLLTLLAPGTFQRNLTNLLDPDPTVFAYVKSDGSWPGFVFKLAAGVSASETQSSLATALEGSSELSNFYLNDPGTPSGAWKSGVTSGVSNRYVSFSKAGFALNYGWVNGYLLISTSYDGFKEAVRRLQ